MREFAEIGADTATMGGHSDDSPLWRKFDPSRGFCTGFPVSESALVSTVIDLLPISPNAKISEMSSHSGYITAIILTLKPPYTRFVRIGGVWRVTVFTAAQEKLLEAGRKSFILDGWTNPKSFQDVAPLVDKKYLTVREIGSDREQYTGYEYKITALGLEALLAREDLQ